MRKTLITLSLLAVIFQIGCSKEDIQASVRQDAAAPAVSDSKVDHSKEWYGSYDYWFEDPDGPDSHFVNDDALILNGEAKVPDNEDIRGTSIIYDMPADKAMNADSSAVNVSIKNINNLINLTIKCKNIRAEVNYRSYADTGIYSISVGSNYTSVKIFPATDFTSFTLLRLTFKQNHVFLKVAGKPVTSLKYAKNSLGKIQQISLTGVSDYIECNSVKIHNSYTTKLLMKEDFNINGESHTIFY